MASSNAVTKINGVAMAVAEQFEDEDQAEARFTLSEPALRALTRALGTGKFSFGLVALKQHDGRISAYLDVREIVAGARDLLDLPMAPEAWELSATAGIVAGQYVLRAPKETPSP